MNKKPWTTSETKYAQELLAQGMNYKQAGAILGRSVGSIHNRLFRAAKMDQTELNATEVAELLGVDKVTVGRYIKRGQLHATQRVPAGRYYISPKAVEMFVRFSPEGYDASKIVDPKLAAIASSPVVLSDKLLTVNEAANVLDLTAHYVRELLREGTLPGKHKLQTYRSYVPRDQVELLKSYRDNWLNTKHCAHILGYSHKSVENLCARHKLRAIKIGGQWYVDPKAVEAYKQTRAYQLANHYPSRNLVAAEFH